MYVLTWKNPTLDANKAAGIQVPVGSIVSNKASLAFTGKGAANYGVIQQENLMRLLESFADVIPPQFPTIGQEWFDVANNTLKVCTSASPLVWKSLGGIQVTNNGSTPVNPSVGDLWFERGVASGVLYVFTGIGRYPSTATTIGGWSQIWPTVEMIAGREEYDYVLSFLSSLMDHYNGGSSALRAIPANSLLALDADLRSKFAAKNPTDLNVLAPAGTSTAELLVDPNSQDWDLALAAAKYAVNRLDLPLGTADDISPMPFVSDGRQAPPELLTLSASDIRYPTLERRSKRRFGAVTLIRAYTETLNILQNAVANRYSMRGVSGSTGGNATFAPEVTTVTQKSFTGNMGGNTTAAVSLNFRFATAEELAIFIQSGGIIQLVMSYALPGSPAAADTNAKALFDQRGVVRITADKTRVFANVLPYTLAAQPSSPGFSVAASAIRLTSQTINGATYTVDAANVGAILTVVINFNSTGSMTGILTWNMQVIRDTTTFVTPNQLIVPIYPGPLPYVSADKTGGSVFLT